MSAEHEEGSLEAHVASLLTAAAGLGPVVAAEVEVLRRAHRDRLVVAVVGRHNTGKSTLVEALYDALDGSPPVPPVAGLDVTRRPLSSGAAVDACTGAVRRFDCPGGRLALVDTPCLRPDGQGGSSRTRALLADAHPDVHIDVLLHLVTRVHAADLAALEAVLDADPAGLGASGAVAVLARADEIGSGHVDALADADAVAELLHGEGRFARLVQEIVPVDARLASGVGQLSELDWPTVSALAGLPAALRHVVLLSADVVVRLGPAITLDGPAGGRGGLDIERTVALLDRLGPNGLRLAVELVAAGAAGDLAGLAAQLRERSHIDRLAEVLQRCFAARHPPLKARATLRRLDRLLQGRSDEPALAVRRRIEAVATSDRTLSDLRTLDALERTPSGAEDLSTAERAAAIRVLGGHGHRPSDRLGVPDLTLPTDRSALYGHAVQQAADWRALAEGPWTPVDTARLARTVLQSLEQLAAELSAGVEEPAATAPSHVEAGQPSLGDAPPAVGAPSPSPDDPAMAASSSAEAASPAIGAPSSSVGAPP